MIKLKIFIMKNKIFIFLSLCAIFILIFIINNYFPKPKLKYQNENKKEELNNKITVKLFYYNPTLDKDENGNIKCSENGLVNIEREIPLTKHPIKDTIELLLKGKDNLTQKDINLGITTEYPLEGLKLKSINLKSNGILVLEFDDPLNKTSGGSCRVKILRMQIEKTAKQFDKVKKVEFIPEYLFQP